MLQARVPVAGLQRSCKCLATLAYRPYTTSAPKQESATDSMFDDLSLAPPPIREKGAIKLRTYTPRTPGLRHLRRPINDHLWKGRPLQELTFPKKGQGKGGRNSTGRVTVRHRGGGHKRRIRMVDFHRNEPGPHVVERVEHDPGRTAHIALVKSKFTKKLTYILAPEGMRAGDVVESYRPGIPDELWESMGNTIDPGVLAAKTVRRGNCLPLNMIPVGTFIFNIGLHEGKGAQLCRGAGTYGILVSKPGKAPPPWEEVKPKLAKEESKEQVVEGGEAKEAETKASSAAAAEAEAEAEEASHEEEVSEETPLTEVEWKRLQKLSTHVNVRLQSGEVRLIHKDCPATIGIASNVNKKYAQLGKAGRKRWLNIRPTVRGVAMNAKDHPHGGGRGKSKGGVHPKSPWGLPAKSGYKTRIKANINRDVTTPRVPPHAATTLRLRSATSDSRVYLISAPCNPPPASVTSAVAKWLSDSAPPPAPRSISHRGGERTTLMSNAAMPGNNEQTGAAATAGAAPGSGGRAESPGAQEGNPGYIPRPKRIACVVCRKRKLRCDGTKPSCGNCSRLGHECAYNEVRKKSGPKRGYVKHLEARLAQVETLLKGVDSAETSRASPPTRSFDGHNAAPQALPQSRLPNIPGIPKSVEADPNLSLDGMDMFGDIGDILPPPPVFPGSNTAPPSDFSWEMIGLGLEEPLPSQEVIDELDEIYFQKIHRTVPMIHKPRYYAAMNLAPSMRPPVCLRYAMWAHAAAATDKYMDVHIHFYNRARKYYELDQMKGLGENIISVAHAQCLLLVGCYEFKMMFFPRAWMSTGAAMRLCLMMGLNRQDGYGLDVKQCLPPARDWTEREERRRTFWGAFCQDRYASAGTGWPMIVDERDILTNLPSTEEAFVNCREQPTPSLAEVISGQETGSLSPYAATILLACMFGRNLHHLHRVTANDKDHDLHGEFWKRHRALDNILLHTSLSLPNHLRLPDGIHDPEIIFCNMCIHTSTICLHQAAIHKAEKHDMPATISTESKRRCIIAADQITNIMKLVSHVDLTTLNPFLVFCLYVAARVFVQYLKSRPQDQAIRSSLQFLLSAMNALKRNIPLAESFLVQLDVDLEGSGLVTEEGVSRFSYSAMQRSPEDDARKSALRAVRSQFEKCAIGIIDIARLDKPDHVRNGSSESPENSSPSDPQGGPHSSRPKPSTKQPHHPQSQTYGLDMPATIPDLRMPPTQDDQFRFMDFDMDVSAGGTSAGSERHLSCSDNPSPNTNKSSNSSFSPAHLDQPSPKQSLHNQQPLPQHFPSSISYTANKSGANFGADIRNHDKSNTLPFSRDFPVTSSGSQLPHQELFTLPDGWDFMQQPSRQTESDLIPPTPSSSTMEAIISSLEEVPWAQSPNAFNSSAWNR
ncbi:C6 transcription factor [Arthroderma uncinatum]|uniref:C6 transcription factor n=1 Tax=Arthroderma uncinatum TaxID=74035 RepID=UPI00144A9F3A|nr:C6 transcription factor [Arthroderma uncinatum]KAF3481469.1 C6 transcription factor [Arthroderma uncinatum]